MIYKFFNITGLLCLFFKVSLSSQLEYKLNILVDVLASILNFIGSIFILSLFFTNGSNLGGWSWAETLIVLGIYNLLESFTISILQPNLTQIVRHVQQGTLDFVLLKPIDSQLWVSFRSISLWGLPSLLCGIILVSYGFYQSDYHFALTTICAFILLLSCSVVILYSLWFLLATTSIWFVKVWNATEVLKSLLMAGKYPIHAYPATLRLIFTYLIPIAFLTTIPAEAVLNRISVEMIVFTLCFTILFFCISRAFWIFALRFYTSASS